MQRERPNRNNLVAGILLVGLGVLLLLGQLFSFNIFGLFTNWNVPYPLFVIVPGILFMAIGMFGGDKLTGFTIFGSIVTVSGAVLAFQEITNTYQTWAYMWTLVFPGSIGLGFAAQSLVTGDNEQRESGLRLMGIALILLLVFGSFFEGFIDLSGFGLNQLASYVGPLLLVALGGWMLLRRSSE